MAKSYIGTSGWSYEHWKDGVFYPENLSSKDQLKFYSQYFQTVEINSSFYHLPLAQTFKNWRNQTPADFLFAVKASRFITHIKRLKDCQEPWQRFIKNSQELKQKLGPILFQLPPNLKVSPPILENFLKLVRKKHPKLKLAFEFRHPSWFSEKTYQLLKKYHSSLVIADSPSYPKEIKTVTDFIYIRMHGSKELFSSQYSQKELKDLAQLIKSFLNQNKDVYVYFNNDFHGYAVENARQLTKFF